MTNQNTKQNKNKGLQRVLKGVIIAIFIFITVSMTATKFIYNFIFKGYDGKDSYCPDNNHIMPIRDEYYYPCGEETLYGYRIKSSVPTDSIVIFAPGFNACSNEYLPLAAYFTAAGYDTFLFDCVGSGNSSGDSYIGFPQEILDLEATLNHVNSLGYDNIFLIGHSRGGYASCCVINGNVPITAVATISGVNSAMDGIMSTSVNAVGNIAYLNYPFLWMYQNELFGYEIANMSASAELSKSSTPALIIHGAGDTQIPKERYSIYSYKNRIRNKNAQFVLYEKAGRDGHTDILFDAGGANEEITAKIDAFFKSHTIKGDS